MKLFKLLSKSTSKVSKINVREDVLSQWSAIGTQVLITLCKISRERVKVWLDHHFISPSIKFTQGLGRKEEVHNTKHTQCISLESLGRVGIQGLINILKNKHI